ncbi:hypothetical protein HX900_18640 [Rhizobium sp. WYCCWR 11290]|uniref:Uncharacterized protein n=2 Tax=Rhizobium TaxID=379 RepID=A0A7Z0RKG1_9HYPH|nr:hypothetical protein [Rhizobium changzhiense]NZD63122.1 hypothetical protein [Rhizobium changzhiense]
MEDPDRKSYFLPFCESPAEEAFLEARIADYKLLPRSGVLFGSGLLLNLQVEHKPYRLDFLANEWLLIDNRFRCIDATSCCPGSPESSWLAGMRQKQHAHCRSAAFERVAGYALARDVAPRKTSETSASSSSLL